MTTERTLTVEAARNELERAIVCLLQVSSNYVDEFGRRTELAEGEVTLAIDALLAAVRAEPPAWQSIATAPKDGTPVRLKWDGTTIHATGYWNTGKNLRFAAADWRDVLGDDLLTTPTHWRPLPSPPEQETP